MKTTFTLGPWKLVKSCTVGKTLDGKFYHKAEICTPNHTEDFLPYIAEVWYRVPYRNTENEALKPDPEQLANAKLIAAAPEMYETARNFLAKIDNMTSEEFQRGEDKEEREALRAILAKVEGGADES